MLPQPPALQLVPTKQEEIDFLDQLSKDLPHASYLRHLFTPQLLLWVADRISRDILPDIIGEYTDDTIRAAKQIADGRTQIGRLHQLYDKNINSLQRQVRELEEEIAHGNATKDVGEEGSTEEKQSQSS